MEKEKGLSYSQNPKKADSSSRRQDALGNYSGRYQGIKDRYKVSKV